MKAKATGRLWLILLGIPPVGWLGLHLAPYMGQGLTGIAAALQQAMAHPFKITIVPNSARTVTICLAVYALAVGIALSSRKNTRNGEEHGSAKWGNAKAVDKKYRQNPPSENKLMTQAVRIGLNGKKHRRNLNTLVCGGSGAGKTRFYCKPNLMQANTSFVILDPKGEIVRDVGNLNGKEPLLQPVCLSPFGQRCATACDKSVQEHNAKGVTK